MRKSNTQMIGELEVITSNEWVACYPVRACVEEKREKEQRKSLVPADTDDQRSNEASQSEQRQLYSCDECAKTYIKKGSLLQHYRNLHSTESHKCTKCNKKFPSKAYLYQHTRRAHSEQQYECAVCKKIYRSKPALNRHVYQVHRPRPAGSGPRIYICDYCQTTSKNKANLSYHITNVHARGSYNCSQCNKSFKCEPYLMRHVARVHTAGAEPSICSCDYCKKIFTDKGTIRRHIARVHSSRSYKCHQCNKIFKCKEYLMGHKKVHPTGAEPSICSCDYCKKIFTDKGTIRKHIARQHSSGSYKCHQCNKIFKCKEYLMGHKTKMHPTGAEPSICSCDYCKKIFTNKGTIRQHIACVHSSRSYKCHQCNKIFKCKEYLRWHKTKVHPAAHADMDKQVCLPATSTPAIATSTNVASSIVVQDDGLNIKEEGADTHMDIGPTVLQHMDAPYRPAQRNVSCVKEERDPLEETSTLKREPLLTKEPSGLQVNEDVAADSQQGSHQLYTCTNCGKSFKSKWQCKRHEKIGKCTRPTAGNTSAAASTSRQRHIVKEEPADGELELGPVVFQHMDCNYRPYKPEPQLD